MTAYQEVYGPGPHGTGDLNLASALMAVGFALEANNECVSVRGERFGKPHGRWYLMPISSDGKLDVHRMMQAWSGIGDRLPKDHCFNWVMAFINYGRAQRCVTNNDWLGAAHDHCRELGLKSDRIAKEAFQNDGEIRTIGDTRQAYIFAFVSCRDYALRLWDQAKRVQVMQTREKSHTLIDAKLPATKRNELLSRLDG